MVQILKYSVLSEEEVNYAAKILINDGVIALRTDTLYGIACLANSNEAIKRLYEIKNRDKEKPISICVDSVEKIFDSGIFCKSVSEDQNLRDLANLTLPGPYTFVLQQQLEEEDKENHHKVLKISNKLNEKIDYLGVRIPNESTILTICQAVGLPLALTSANLSGEKSPLEIKDFANIWGNLDLILDGGRIDASGRTGSSIFKFVEKMKESGEITTAVELVRRGEGYEEICVLFEKMSSEFDFKRPDEASSY